MSATKGDELLERCIEQGNAIAALLEIKIRDDRARNELRERVAELERELVIARQFVESANALNIRLSEEIQQLSREIPRLQAPAQHNHMTRDIKPQGQCGACDEYRGRVLRKQVAEDPDE